MIESWTKSSEGLAARIDALKFWWTAAPGDWAVAGAIEIPLQEAPDRAGFNQPVPLLSVRQP